MKRIAITMGDPNGIGPEIIVKMLADSFPYDQCFPVVIGNKDVLQEAANVCGVKDFLQKYSQYVYHVDTGLDQITPGTVTEAGGRAAFEYIRKSVDLCMSGECQAVATAPINKESLKAANVPYIGHTEIYAGLTDTKDPLTMFETDGLRIFFLTRHLSLRNSIDALSEERLIDYIVRCTEALNRIGVQQGVMAVAGLNPHNGEHGLFGDEEGRIIEPAIEKAKKILEKKFANSTVTGPVAADSVFHLAHKGRYSAVLSLYHDQGHIAAKTLDFERTISITHGLPFLRTSVDHGTAFDIAWKNMASSVSMHEAVVLACKYEH
ncbi:MAG: 4-hydroxythreonine-4-phosphate dehydrogenase PdxA [Ruminococcaceae bacterium]|nr:4-hydroxythreonine-4-phosphate dehydrogenase PdxA [Oscillospiraceae bacterium]